MKLGIAIGNTNIVIGYYENGKLVLVRFSHKDYKKLEKYKHEEPIIASVVPLLTEKVQQIFENYTMAVPSIKTTYKTAGIDRLLVCEVALKKYSSPLIVIDTGTAITINVVDKVGIFLGGSILPGLSMSLDALGNAALLPSLKLEEKAPIIGTNTEQAMLSGVIQGTASCLTDMIKKIEREVGSSKVILTGGGATILMKYIEVDVIYEKELLMEGILSS